MRKDPLGKRILTAHNASRTEAKVSEDFKVDKRGLLWTVSGVASAITPIPGVDDSWVLEAFPDNNYGADTTISIGSSGFEEIFVGRRAFLNRPGGSTLNIWLNQLTPGGVSSIDVDYYEIVAPIDEDIITWNNQPAFGDQIGTITIDNADEFSYIQFPNITSDAVVLVDADEGTREALLACISKEGAAEERPYWT